MTRLVLLALSLFLISPGLVLAEDRPRPFEEAAVYLEQNVTDQDVEVVFEATGRDDGLAALQVVAPDGRTVVDFKAPDSKLGIRGFKFESPEPKNDGRIQADFPEGEYAFTGTTVTGVRLRAKARLSHKLPDPVSLGRPRAEEEEVPTKGLKITWSSVAGLDACIVVLEQEERGVEITARLPGTATTFAVPDGFLLPDTEYTLAIGAVTNGGNTSFVETTFTTAAKK